MNPLCPDCGAEISIEDMDEYWERICYGCGWFDMKRYTTRGEAEQGEVA